MGDGNAPGQPAASSLPFPGVTAQTHEGRGASSTAILNRYAGLRGAPTPPINYGGGATVAAKTSVLFSRRLMDAAVFVRGGGAVVTQTAGPGPALYFQPSSRE